MTLGLVLFLGGAAAAGYCLATIFDGTPECTTAAITGRELADAERQAQAAAGTPIYERQLQRTAALSEQLRRQNSICEDSVFAYWAYTSIAVFFTLFGSLFLGLAKLIKRRRRFAYYVQLAK